MTGIRKAVAPALLAACFVLGGASAAGFFANLLLQWLALAAIAWALLAPAPVTMLPEGRRLLWIGALVVAVFAVQLIPLPPALWSALPGRGDVVAGYRLLGQPLPWMPVSLAWRNTLASFLWLLPAFAAALVVLRQGAFSGRLIAWTVIAAMVVNVLAGALQLGGGLQSPWYFYATTNRGTGVGLFANGNHTASLLVCTIPFLAAIRAEVRGGSARRASAATTMAIIAFAVVLVGLLLNFSLAGFVLAVPATLASVLLLQTNRPERRIPRWGLPALAVLTAVAVATIFVGPFGNNLVGTTEAAGNLSRATDFAVTAKAAVAHAPLGSGIGTFQTIYREREDPRSVDRVFQNHTHNDYLEIALETGVLGLGTIVLFGLWWLAQVVRVWRDPGSSPYVKAATIATGALLAHSTVDYPLRTAALSVLFAIGCAMLAQRPVSGRATQGRARHLSA